ncbi:type 1 glutamine amidotransferase domain-containing protein [Streptomyces arenae]|uniref:type 1 glutamine amidotransferase domain-containing protein n=1 Tax=Streptomyces arenae TaxID=29301 RepID=UPI002658AE30|nr:type 1 glutamine amidotransferase domain-containing protein [Streptomyces arenae]MCG7207420.1 type 1 glutamine amidotransferase domain-containing protein [Streptomyces arenae]
MAAVNHRILVIVTNVDEYQNVGLRTGLWLGELTHFWDFAEEHGFSTDLASPSGGRVPLDPESLTAPMLDDHGTGKRYLDRDFMNLLGSTMKISDASVDDYDAIYLTGGHGVMFDFPQNRDLRSLIVQFYETDRVVSAVCHGVAGLLEVTLSSGNPLVQGKKVTGFSWPEEELANRATAVPYNLQEELQKLGADYSTASQPFTPYVVVDENLITGQNPFSAREVAEEVIKQLTAD